MSEKGTLSPWLPAAVVFLLGGLFLWAVDNFSHIYTLIPLISEAEGIRPTTKKRSTLLVLAITSSNIPEGLAVGVLFC